MNELTCLICGELLKDRFDLVCKDVKCLHELSYRQAKAHQAPAYKQYLYFYSYTITQLLMSEDMPLDELTIY